MHSSAATTDLAADSGAAASMKPTTLRAGAPALRYGIGRCEIGFLLVAAGDRGVCAVLLGDGPDALTGELQHRFLHDQRIRSDAELETPMAAVAQLVDGRVSGLELPLDPRGTAFQRRVWHTLRDIPAGAMATYTQIAERIGAPGAARAVAGACAANPLAVVVPCHRVIRSDGGLSGYRWGVERKRALLRREAGA
jgi:AraC family transcriptional regulator, regulatory protein of adaptative response / methylated-DNA-[protein]-cysteine methyltransferase